MTLTPPAVTEAPRGATRVPPRVRRSLPSIAALVAAIGLGASVALPFRRESWAAFTAPGGAATFFGDITALAGTYLLLVMVLLAARIPAIERGSGRTG